MTAVPVTEAERRIGGGSVESPPSAAPLPQEFLKESMYALY